MRETLLVPRGAAAAADGWDERRVGPTGSVDQVQHALADVVGRQEIFECIAIEQCGPLVVLIRAFDLDAEDLPGMVEYLPDPKRLVISALEDLHA